MPVFKLKADLPRSTQNEIDRIQAIPIGLRLTSESNFLTALYDYLYNEVVLRDSLNRIVIASGVTVPTNESGFKKGAIFIDKNGTNEGWWLNTKD